MFGQFVKDHRLGKNLSLREFCRALSLDASNWSKVERGLLPPPQDQAKLQQIAVILDIRPASAKFQELTDLAAIDAGTIPKDILGDKEIIKSLPMFFRTVRSEKPTSEEIEKLIQKIRSGD